MSDACRRLILDRIRHHGPITFAQFMELALYDPASGYYAKAAQRSGQKGDFYTNVDVSPLFGEILAEQIVEMAGVMGPSKLGRYDLLEAGAGNGRLSRDVVDAIEATAPGLYSRLRLHLVERSAAARQFQRDTLGSHAAKLASSGERLPPSIQGVIFANELLDALPTHVVVGGTGGIREIFIDARGDELFEREMPPSTDALARYFADLGAQVPPGWRFEVNLRALEWMREAAGALADGFLLLVDYGHEAKDLYSEARKQGTLATFTGHVVEALEAGRVRPWLRDPGDSDITAHVDFTSVRRAAETEGLTPICTVDQMHFLLGVGVEARVRAGDTGTREDAMRRLALKTLLMPGGLGTSHHVLIFGKGVGRPKLRGCSTH